MRALKPDMAKVAALDHMAVIATAPGGDCDFVSRFFVPSLGIPEDPVTGSAHCTLVPYWSKRLGKTRLFARQVSARGGELWCEDRGERVSIAGRCVRYLEGTIEIPGAEAERTAVTSADLDPSRRSPRDDRGCEMIEQLLKAHSTLNGWVWGPVTMILLMGTGLYLTILLRGVQFRWLGKALREVLGKVFTKTHAEGTVTPFQAVATALASTVGVGNIAGVSTAITIGGPGALFWLIVSGLLGMGTKFAEVVLAITYREQDDTGTYRGGAMYILKNGLEGALARQRSSPSSPRSPPSASATWSRPTAWPSR